MALPSLSWGRYISVVLLYWLLVVGGWRFYTTRPSTQRRAREQHLIAERKDPVTGGLILTFSYPVNFLPICALLFRPPPSPFLLWLALRRQWDVTAASSTTPEAFARPTVFRKGSIPSRDPAFRPL